MKGNIFHGHRKSDKKSRKVWRITSSRVEGKNIWITAERDFDYKMGKMDEFLFAMDPFTKHKRHFKLGVVSPWFVGYYEDIKKPSSSQMMEMKWNSGF